MQDSEFKLYTRTIFLKAKLMTKEEAIKSNVINSTFSQFYKNWGTDGYCVLLDNNKMDWIPKDYFEKYYKQVIK